MNISYLRLFVAIVQGVDAMRAGPDVVPVAERLRGVAQTPSRGGIMDARSWSCSSVEEAVEAVNAWQSRSAGKNREAKENLNKMLNEHKTNVIVCVHHKDDGLVQLVPATDSENDHVYFLKPSKAGKEKVKLHRAKMVGGAGGDNVIEVHCGCGGGRKFENWKWSDIPTNKSPPGLAAGRWTCGCAHAKQHTNRSHFRCPGCPKCPKLDSSSACPDCKDHLLPTKLNHYTSEISFQKIKASQKLLVGTGVFGVGVYFTTFFARNEHDARQHTEVSDATRVISLDSQAVLAGGGWDLDWVSPGWIPIAGQKARMGFFVASRHNIQRCVEAGPSVSGQTPTASDGLVLTPEIWEREQRDKNNTTTDPSGTSRKWHFSSAVA